MFVSIVAGEALSLGVNETDWKAVANVIVNRSKERGKSIEDVITDKNVDGSRQFDSYGKYEYNLCMEYLNSRDGSNGAYETLIAAVMPVYNGEEEDITSGSTYYYNDLTKDLSKIDFEGERTLIAGQDYYKTYRLVRDNTSIYLTVIYGNDNEIIDKGVTYGVEPTITKTGDIIKIHIGYGTETYVCRYYDAVKRTVSEWFENPIKESGSLVGYMLYSDAGNKLVVRDIFDKNAYYREFERDFSGRVIPLLSAEFIDGGAKLRITYSTEEGKREATETLDLS
jgi:hypothetical protein